MAKEKKESDRKELKKHSATIQIEGNITLLQRKTWNALLWHAYEELPAREVHSIAIQRLANLTGYDSKDTEYLKETSLALMRCILQCNVLGKDDKNVWSAMVLLAQAKIDGGFLTYAYPPELRHRLYNPEMYARLDLDMQKRFGSKYALALWEICTDYLGSKRDFGETSWISLEEFRQLMGVEQGEYTRFNNLNIRVITPALSEINGVSDFRVMVEYQHRGRKVTALKFTMRRVVMLPEPARTQASLFPELDDMPLVVKEMKDAGLSTQDALEIWQKGFKFVEEGVRPVLSGDDEDATFRQYVREKIHLLKRRQASAKVENSTGFLREALKKNYANPEFAQENTRQKMAETQQDAKRRKEEKQQLERQLEALKRACDESVSAICAEIATSLPDVLETATQSVVAANAILRELYKSDRPALDNYHASPFLAGMVNPFLQCHAPDRIQDAKEPYAPQIAALEAQIAALA